MQTMPFGTARTSPPARGGSLLLNGLERAAAPDAATKSPHGADVCLSRESPLRPDAPAGPSAVRVAGIASIRLDLRADNAAALSFYRSLVHRDAASAWLRRRPCRGAPHDATAVCRCVVSRRSDDSGACRLTTQSSSTLPKATDLRLVRQGVAWARVSLTLSAKPRAPHRYSR